MVDKARSASNQPYSTLSRWQSHGAVLLRPGHISARQIAEVIGVMPNMPDATAPRASGTLEAHYAPRTPVLLLSGSDLPAQLAKLVSAGKQVAVMGYSRSDLHGAVAKRILPTDATGYAHALYASLRILDDTGADCILVELPPTG